jgi:hypothetical protein
MEGRQLIMVLAPKKTGIPVTKSAAKPAAPKKAPGAKAAAPKAAAEAEADDKK